MATYRSTAPDQIARARLLATAHIIDSPSGRCRECRHPWPCLGHLEATVTLNRYGGLPRRTPGATRPELIQQAVAGERLAWFGQE